MLKSIILMENIDVGDAIDQLCLFFQLLKATWKCLSPRGLIKMKYVSLFAGIGGFDLALNRLGHECVYTNEWDKYAAQVYEKNFKHQPDTRDIKLVSTGEIPDHDLLVGGFPCQAFSIAGKRRGFAETRGTLFFDVARILKDKRPRYFILENVKGLLSHDSGKTLQTILGVLSDLGYEYQWQVLNSKNFGVPQNRERIYIVGNIRGAGRPKIFPITDQTETNLGGDQKFVDLQLMGAKITSTTRTIQARYHKGYSTRDGENSGVLVGTLRTHKDGEGFRQIKSGISPTIPARAREDGSGQPIVALREVRSDEAKKIRSEMIKNGKDWSPRRSKNFMARTDGLIGTVTAARNYDTTLLDELSVRRLTPIECERLQGFPDNWTKFGLMGGGIVEMSDTQRYKQLGNAVTVNVVYEVAKRFEAILTP